MPAGGHSRDSFCHACGARFPEASRGTYPKTCGRCGVQVWANPLPVGVALVPVTAQERLGLLVIRRAIPPGVGKLALVGGFLEEAESWQRGAAREVREEAGLVVDPATFEVLWLVSSEPRPNRLLIFATCAPVTLEALPPFAPNAEVSERGLIFGAGALDEQFAFPMHAEAARRFFARRGVEQPHGFVPA